MSAAGSTTRHHPPVIPHIIDQHAEEAAFLWELRASAVHQPHYTASDVAALDERVEAHLDGLRIAADYGWEVAAANLVAESPGEVFAAAVLAIESHDTARLERVLEATTSKAEARLGRGFISAMGWVDARHAEPLIHTLLHDGRPERRILGLRGAGVRRHRALLDVDPTRWRDDPSTEAPLLRGLGELGAVERLHHCLRGLRSECPEVRFWSAWSSTLLCHRDAVGILRELAEAPGPHAARALQLAGRALPMGSSLAWHAELAAQPGTLRLAVQLAGAMGVPGLVPWLMEQMSIPDVARVAGESFSMLTGLDLAYDDLDRDAPDGFSAGPTESPDDEDIRMDADENLPWPDPALVSRWWAEHSDTFVAGHRYLLGSRIGPTTEPSGKPTQRQRAACAIEAALAAPDRPLTEVRTRQPRHTPPRFH